MSRDLWETRDESGTCNLVLRCIGLFGTGADLELSGCLGGVDVNLEGGHGPVVVDKPFPGSLTSTSYHA